MTRIIDLIPTDVRNRWDGFDCKIEAPLTLGNESTLVAALLNKDGSKIVVAFDLHEGVEVKKKSKHDKAVELLKRWDSVKIPSTVWTTPAEDYGLPEDTQSFLNGIENNKEVK